MAPTQSRAGLGIEPSSKTTTTAGREWSCENIEDTKEKLSKTTTLHKKGIPASIGMDDLAKVPYTQLPRPFSEPLQLESHRLGLTGFSVSRLKPPEDSLPRPYWDPEALPPRPCKSRSLISIGGRMREFAKEWICITQDPFMLGTIQGHLLKFNQKPPLIKSTNKCEVKVPKAQVSEGTIELGPGNKGFFTYPFLIPPKKWGKPRYHEPKAAEQVHYLHKVKNDHPEADKGGHSSRTMGSLTQHQINILPHSNCKETSLLPSFAGEKAKSTSSRPCLLLSNVPKTFTRVMKPILHLCWKMGITTFLYLESALVLANSYTQKPRKMGRG